MDCPDALSEGVKWSKDLWEKALRQRVPLLCSLELTARCNLDCVHCYFRPQSLRRQRRCEEMPCQRVLSVLDEMADAGALYLLLTGGEPFLREDFEEIYLHAKRNGFLVTVFTNGTLLNDGHLRLFRDMPPRSIEISLYGATPQTYERITRAPGSFERCMRTVRALAGEGFNLRLKTMLMAWNQHEIPAMREMARELNAHFRFDPDILPAYEGRTAPPEGLRLSPEESVAFELSDQERLSQMLKYLSTRKRVPPEETLVVCGAGRGTLHVDAYGRLSPCLSMEQCRIPMEPGQLLHLWENDILEFVQRKIPENYPCNACEARILCRACVAACFLETGSSSAIPDYQCRGSRLRFEALMEKSLHLAEETRGFHAKDNP